ncbi:DUF3034 family protein [Hydrogenophaga sp. MI9]|uniref:DUF3034 family protein n=1 Tax=Hydrogenophaga sp. MI9 TaxID=3453719 RepID=UPI003EED1708
MPHAPLLHRHRIPTAALLALGTAALLAHAPAHADTGKLLLTGGVSTIDGAAGGGLSPWALIGSQATAGETGVSTYLSHARTQDYRLNAYGVAVGLNDRIELSAGHQDFDTGITGTLLGLPGLHLKQDILGAKLRVAGDAVLDSDSLMPQIAVGVQAKRLGSSGLDATLKALGAKRTGTDFYVSATKLFLAQGLLVNGTLRATKANQGGLLGHGATLGGADNGYELMPELSVAWLLRKDVAVGVEVRAMPDKLNKAGAAAGLGNGLRAGSWKDLFIAWAPNKNVSLTLAYVDLGTVVPATTKNKKQTGAYLSAQLAF